MAPEPPEAVDAAPFVRVYELADGIGLLGIVDIGEGGVGGASNGPDIDEDEGLPNALTAAFTARDEADARFVGGGGASGGGGGVLLAGGVIGAALGGGGGGGGGGAEGAGDSDGGGGGADGGAGLLEAGIGGGGGADGGGTPLAFLDTGGGGGGLPAARPASEGLADGLGGGFFRLARGLGIAGAESDEVGTGLSPLSLGIGGAAPGGLGGAALKGNRGADGRVVSESECDASWSAPVLTPPLVFLSFGIPPANRPAS